jgi:hypothetical protein
VGEVWHAKQNWQYVYHILNSSRPTNKRYEPLYPLGGLRLQRSCALGLLIGGFTMIIEPVGKK